MTDRAGLPAAVVFDLDGLLVDTEALWREAQIAVLGGCGVPLGPERCRTTKGMFVGEVVQHWHERHPWPAPSVAQVTDELVAVACDLISARAGAMPGSAVALERCAALGLPVAVASSSPLRVIRVALRAVGLTDLVRLVCSAEQERRGKPDPAVYLRAAERLGVPAGRCVAVEDAPVGVRAAVAAGMRCLAVPEPREAAAVRAAGAAAVLASLDELDAELLAGTSPGPELPVAPPAGVPARTSVGGTADGEVDGRTGGGDLRHRGGEPRR